MKTKNLKLTNVLLKVTLFVVLLALAVTSFITAPVMASLYVLAQSASTASSNLKLLNLPSTVKVKNSVLIPLGETNDGTVALKIYSPKGELVFDSANPTSEQSANLTATTYNFTPSKIGTYKLVYSVASVGKLNLTEQTYKLVVTGQKPTMEFEENSKYIIPSVTNKQQVVLPNPVVKNEAGEELDLTSTNYSITVQDTADYSEYYSSLASDDYFLKKLASGNYAFTPKTNQAQTTDENSSYVVKYTFTDVSTGLDVSETFEIEYIKNYDPTKIDLGYRLSGSIPESMELGKEVSLPTVSIYDKKDSEVKLTPYTDIVVRFYPNEAAASKYTLDADKDYVTVATSGKFKPMYPSKDGYYKIVYKVYTFFDSETQPSETLIYTINDVKDSTKPVVYAVDEYKNYVTVENNTVTGISDSFEMKDASYKIPSKVKTGTVVYLPAVYATDEFSSYEKLVTKFERRVIPEGKAGTTITTCLKEVSGSAELQDVAVSSYETASYKFTEAGTYTIRYSAEDEAGNLNSTGLNFTIVVEDDFEDTLAPRITMKNVSKKYKKGEVISFTKPTAVDYKSANVTESESVDKDVEIAYYYYTGTLNEASLEAELAKARKGETSTLTAVLEDEDDSSKLTFTMPDSNVTFVCVAYDDSNNMAYETREIEVIASATDSVAPSLVTAESDYLDELDDLELKQDSVISLPEITFTDNNAQYLEGDIKVLDKDGSAVSVVGAKYNLDGSNFTISNARFVASKSGEYTIVYTMSDIGGNYFVTSYYVSVADTRAPSIKVDGSQNRTVQVGQTEKLSLATVEDDGQVIDRPVEVEFIGDNNPSYRFNKGTLEFTALETGTFSYIYRTTDASGNPGETGTFTITAVDSEKPVITLDKDVKTYEKLEKVNPEDTSYKAIVIPGFTSEDVLNGIKEEKVEVQSPTSKLTVNKEDDGTYTFVPTLDGTYTITYIAIDNANNKTEEVHYMKVGDNAKPTITINNTADNAPAEMKAGSTLKLDLESISVTDSSYKDIDGESTVLASNLKDEQTNDKSYRLFSVQVKNAEGTVISVDSGKQFEYTLENAGKYTITYTARDKAGNIETEVKYVEVTAEKGKTEISNETWGVILIVISVLVLGGVVIYFVRTRDRKPKKLPTLDSKKEDK